MPELHELEALPLRFPRTTACPAPLRSAAYLETAQITGFVSRTPLQTATLTSELETSAGAHPMRFELPVGRFDLATRRPLWLADLRQQAKTPVEEEAR